MEHEAYLVKTIIFIYKSILAVIYKSQYYSINAHFLILCRMQFLSLNAYDRHKMLVNEYLLSYAGASEKVLKRDTSKDKTDLDVIRENHKVCKQICKRNAK